MSDRALTPAMVAALSARRVRWVWLADVVVAEGHVRVWTGHGTITFNGDDYTGIGSFGGVSQVEETSDLKATGITLQLSGVPPELLQVALAQIRYNRSATVWLGLLDLDTGALIDDPIILFEGRTDNASITESGETASIQLAVENRLITLDRPRERRYTSEDQQTYYPDDLGFDFVPALQTKKIVWGSG